MFSTRGEDYQYMSDAQAAGATSEKRLICWPASRICIRQKCRNWNAGPD
jgi:conjugal transfer ATP-binding protein TraC